jgi:hypothetical protein
MSLWIIFFLTKSQNIGPIVVDYAGPMSKMTLYANVIFQSNIG